MGITRAGDIGLSVIYSEGGIQIISEDEISKRVSINDNTEPKNFEKL